MGSEKFWDKNPGKFRFIFIVVSTLLVGMIFYNIINYSSAIFSGTNYLQLPSKLYIKRNITLKSVNGTIDTIKAGSFLLRINGSSVSNLEGYNNILENINEDSIVFLSLFNIEKIDYIDDVTSNKFFDISSDTIYLRKSEIPEDFIRFLTSGSFIGYIIPDGATYRAGLKTGDLLLTIKDREVIMDKSNSWHDGFDLEFYRFFRSLSRGEPIPYTVLRNGEQLTFNVWLATFGVSTIIFFVILCGFSYIVIGVYYGTKRPNLIAARLTSVGFVMIGFEIVMSLNIGYPGFSTYNFIKIFLANTSLIFFLPVVFHSLLYFPVKHEIFLNNKWHLRIIYFISVVTFGFFTFFYFKGKDDSGVILFLLLANIIYYTVVRIIYIKKIPEKNKLRRKISIIWIIVFLSAFMFPVLYFFGIKWISVVQEYNFLILFLIPLSYLYFTWRYRLLDIDFRLRRNIQYVLVTVLWKIILTGIFLCLLWKASVLNIEFPNITFTSSNIQILSIPLDSDTNQFYNKLLFILIAFISGAFLLKVGRISQNYFDKKFYRQKFDYKYAQEELVRLLQKKFTIESLAKLIVEKVSLLVRVKNAGIVFSGDGKKLWDGKIYCFSNTESKLYDLNIEQKCFDSIKGFKGTFSINYLTAESKDFLECNNFLNVVPIRVNERLLGALFIGEKLSEILLRGDDFEFLSAIITSISIAVENAFLYEELTKRERIKRELEIAHNIQVASLPQDVPTVPGLDIYATSIPALEVGGDFYDFLNGTANGLTIVMGDVSGKGTSAALYMSKVQGIFQTLHEFNLSPVKLLTRANHLLYRHIDSKSYITAVGASFDTENKTLSFARAGHLPLYYYNHNLKEIRKLQPCGMGLGLSEKNIFDYSIEEIKIEYSEGDVFLFVSDGVIEALNRAGEQFGEAKLIELVKLNTEFDSRKMVTEILESVKSFTSDTSQYDDITVVAVKSV